MAGFIFAFLAAVLIWSAAALQVTP